MTTKQDLLNQAAKLEAELKTLQEQINNITDNVASDRWKPSTSQWYYTTFGHFYQWDPKELDINLFETGNVFETKEKAEKELKRQKMFIKLKDFAGNWEPNWESTMDYKYSIVFDVVDKQFFIQQFNLSKFPMLVYFKTFKHAQEAIELFGDELKILFED